MIRYPTRASNKVFAGQDFLNSNTSLKCLIQRTYVLYYQQHTKNTACIILG
nr:MAG TPA: hypothetical protein [Caudoviricetes sp.]